MDNVNEIIPVKPEYGVNYKEGYIGFTFEDGSFLSEGIVWFSRWDKGKNPDVPNIPISHCFIVTDKDEIVESWVPRIRTSKLSDYFNNPKYHVVFRKPRGMTDIDSRVIVAQAKSELGKSYDISLVIALLITNTFIGKLLEKITGGISTTLLTDFLNKKQAFMCSELVGYVLNTLPKYKGLSILSKPVAQIEPQQLFEDKTIFTPWSVEVKGQKI